MPEDADDPPNPLDELLNEIHDPVPALSSELRWAFICDIAQETYPVDEIAARYGFPNGREMVDYIAEDPTLIAQIRVRRAYWNSDVGLPEKLRTLYGHSLQYAGKVNAVMMLDPREKAEHRLDMARLHARIAGVDGLPQSRDAAGFGGIAGTKFFLQINLGEKEPQVLIDTTVAENDGGEPGSPGDQRGRRDDQEGRRGS